jgi:large subunit ribosomal protein L24
MKIKKGDKVKIITGKDKGKTGKVVRVLVAKNKVIVDGLNMTKKHQRARKSGEKGSIISMAMPIHASNVAKED